MASILVVDDHVTNRQFLLTLLAYQGHRLFEAASAVEALQVVHHQRPDLVIADIVMPTMDGYEFVRQLRAEPTIAGTQVIFYTATYNEREARALALACGVEHILSKPAEPQEILNTVAAVLHQPRPLSDGRLLDHSFEREHTRLLTDKLARKVEELETTNQTLERHAAALEQEIEARKELFQQVQVGRERLQHLSRRLVRAQEEERRRLARELHDEIGQALTATQLNLQVLLELQDPQELKARLEDSLLLVEQLLQQVRTLSLDLRPSMLDDLGLASALRWYLYRQAERAGFEVHYISELAEIRFPSEIETTCFRIAQESLTNIVRHARAQLVTLELHLLENCLHLIISDNGVGFDVAAARIRAAGGSSLGLLGMQERALLIGGQVIITSAPGKGTTLSAEFPLPDELGATMALERRTEPR